MDDVAGLEAVLHFSGYRFSVQFIWTPATGGCLNFPKAGRHRVARKHLIGSLEWVAKVEVQQRVHSQELYYQVLLLMVVVGACARNIVLVFPEENKYSTSFISLL